MENDRLEQFISITVHTKLVSSRVKLTITVAVKPMALAHSIRYGFESENPT